MPSYYGFLQIGKILWSISLDLFETEKKLISFYKAFSSISRKKEKFNIFNQIKNSIAKFINILFSKSKRYYLLEKKNKKLSSIEILIKTVLMATHVTLDLILRTHPLSRLERLSGYLHPTLRG